MRFTHPDTIRSVTSLWDGERAENGRPLVSDDILERMKLATTEEAWQVIARGHGYWENFEGGWKNLHPEHVMVGRAVTCRYVPLRPDLEGAVDLQGETEERRGVKKNSWVIDELVEGDVVVVDLFGKVRDGVFAGDNLATAIKENGARGMVVDGGLRDTPGIRPIPDFGVLVRDLVPTGFAAVSMVEINGITKIGQATCLPGDVVHASETGVLFIPPHLAQEVVEFSEHERMRDIFGKQRIAEGVYTPAEVDADTWSDEMNADLAQWLENRRKQD